MNKRVILIALTAVMLSTVSYAQEVIIENNAVIIDCSKVGSKFYVSDTKARTTTATNSTAGPDDLSVISSNKSNEKVYKKFEVHKTDNGTKNWKDAIVFCAATPLNGSTGWRLPTQRELMLIWILKEKLYANDVSPFTAGNYWGATEHNESYAWFVTFSDGTTIITPKTDSSYNVRCIRDI